MSSLSVTAKTMLRCIMLQMALLFSAESLFGQAVEVDISVPAHEALIGKHVHVTITAKADRLTLLEWSKIGDALPPGLEILKVGRVDTLRGQSGLWLFQKTIILTAFDSGTYILPPLEIIYKLHGSAGTNSVATTPMELRFNLVDMADDDVIKDIAPPLKVPVSPLEIIILIGIIIILLVAIWLIIRYFIKKANQRKRNLDTISEVIEKAPWETAIADLEELRRGILSDGEH